MNSAASFQLDGQPVDVFDLQTLLTTHGLCVPEAVAKQFERTYRLAR